ncbi:MAG: hypothetical protein ACRDTG_30720 [Pseudonocardiaceae bacterium]
MRVLADEVVLAHHPIIAALPFVVPTLVITLLVVVMAVRDRRRHDPLQDKECGQDNLSD